MNLLYIISFAIVVAIIFAGAMGMFYLARKIIGIRNTFTRIAVIFVMIAFSVYCIVGVMSIAGY